MEALKYGVATWSAAGAAAVGATQNPNVKAVGGNLGSTIAGAAG